MTSKQAIAQLESWSMEDTKEQEIQNEQKRYFSKIEKIVSLSNWAVIVSLE